MLLVSGVAQARSFLSSEVGQQTALDQTGSMMEAFGDQHHRPDVRPDGTGIKRAAITGPIFQAIFFPIVIAIEAGILVVIFSLADGRRGDVQAGLRRRRRTRR